MIKDLYRTLKVPAEGIYKEKGSKFLAYAFPVQSPLQTKEILISLRKEHHTARHFCYAYRIGIQELQYRVNDDGEPSGTAGKPIYGQILSKDLTNILIVVVRYFGGTLLGTSGLIRSYRSAAEDCLTKATIVQQTDDVEFRLFFNYEQMNAVMRIIKEEKVKIINQGFENRSEMILKIRRANYGKVKERFLKIGNLDLISC